MPVNPNAYYRVILLVLGQEVICAAFTVGGFLSENSGQIGNAALQYLAFSGMQAVGKKVAMDSITSIAIPAIANTELIQTYINCPSTAQSPEMKALTIGLLYIVSSLF